MGVTAQEYAFRATAITGDVKALKDSYAGAGSTLTKATFSGTANTIIRIRPELTTTTTTTVPGAPSTASNQGWRLTDADLDSTATAKRKLLAGSVVVDLWGNSDAALGVTCIFTSILYRRLAGGTTAELARGTSGSAGFSSVATGHSQHAMVLAQDVILEADEELQVELYIQGQGLAVLGSAQTVTLFTDGTSNANCCNILFVAPGIRTRFLTSLATAISLTADITVTVVLGARVAALSLVAAATRRITANRSGTGALSLTALLGPRTIFTSPKVAALALGTVVQKFITLIPKSTALTLTATALKTVILLPKTTALSLAAAASRQIAANRSGTAALSLGTVFGRKVIAARAFTTALTLTAKGRIDMALEVLNRIASGGVTIVRKVINIFDD